MELCTNLSNIKLGFTTKQLQSGAKNIVKIAQVKKKQQEVALQMPPTKAQTTA